MINLPCKTCKGQKYTYFMHNDVPWTQPCQTCNGSGESIVKVRTTEDTLQDHIDLRLEACGSRGPTDSNITGDTVTISNDPLCRW